MAAIGENPVLVLKPKFVTSIIFLRTAVFYFFGAAFLSVLGIGAAVLVRGLAGGGSGEEDFRVVIPAVIAVWTLLYLYFLLSFAPRRYAYSSYKFYPDRVECEAGMGWSLVSRAVVYARLIETGAAKEVLQLSRGMGNIVLKVAAAGANPGPQSTVLLDNLVLRDIENIEENLEKVREIIKNSGNR